MDTLIFFIEIIEIQILLNTHVPRDDFWKASLKYIIWYFTTRTGSMFVNKRIIFVPLTVASTRVGSLASLVLTWVHLSCGALSQSSQLLRYCHSNPVNKSKCLLFLERDPVQQHIFCFLSTVSWLWYIQAAASLLPWNYFGRDPVQLHLRFYIPTVTLS